MAEYISKQAFKEKYLCCGWLPEMSEEEFNSFPAAGVVPVVRCRECKHWLPRQGCSGCHHRRGLWEPQEDDYCSHGE